MHLSGLLDLPVLDSVLQNNIITTLFSLVFLLAVILCFATAVTCRE